MSNKFRLGVVIVVVSVVLLIMTFASHRNNKNVPVSDGKVTCLNAPTLTQMAKMNCMGTILAMVQGQKFYPWKDGKGDFDAFEVASTGSNSAEIQFESGYRQTVSTGQRILGPGGISLYVLKTLPDTLIVFLPFEGNIGWQSVSSKDPKGTDALLMSVLAFKGYPGQLVPINNRCFSAPVTDLVKGTNKLLFALKGKVQFDKTVGYTELGQPISVYADDNITSAQIGILLAVPNKSIDPDVAAVGYFVKGLYGCEAG